jgi:hypothetical protein
VTPLYPQKLTLGWLPLSLDLGLRRDFTWRFIIADVTQAIIGADFLSHYGLVVNLRKKRLLDETTSLSTTLQPPYSGPYLIKSRSNKTMTLLIHGKLVTVSTDRAKPAYIFHEDDSQHTTTKPAASTTPTTTPPETPTNVRLFITDKLSKLRFLIDTGSDLCVFPVGSRPCPPYMTWRRTRS